MLQGSSAVRHTNGLYLFFIGNKFIDICFYYQGEHDTLNTEHLFFFCNMFRSFVLAIVRCSDNNINGKILRWRRPLKVAAIKIRKFTIIPREK